MKIYTYYRVVGNYNGLKVELLRSRNEAFARNFIENNQKYLHEIKDWSIEEYHVIDYTQTTNF